MDCPQCSPGSGRFRMGMSLVWGNFACWMCGKLDRRYVLRSLLRLSDPEINSIYRRLDRGPVRIERRPGKLVLPRGVEPMRDTHRRYLINRGFDPGHLERTWGIKGTTYSGVLSWRIFIPIHDRSGREVSWTTRSICKKSPAKYISASADQEEVPHKELLYGEHKVPGAGIIVHEGPADVWKTGPGAVATLGVATTPAQVSKILHYPVRVICFDNEPDAQARAQKLCRELSVFPGKTINVRLNSKDAGEAGSEEIQELRATIQ